ncbi:MAG: methyltransferase [Gammaproteobacteria bacterium]
MPDTPHERLQPDTINAHLAHVYPALAMLAGMQLEVFTPLADGPCEVEALAGTLGVAPEKLRPLLHALVTAGLLTLTGTRFANTPEAMEFLVKGRPRYLGGTAEAYADLWSATLHTAASIRTGMPQARHDFARMTSDELRAFIRGIDAGAGATARRLHKDWPLSTRRRLLDAGGGAGGLAIALCRLLPDLTATVAELPAVAAIARECVAEAALGERVTVVDADLIAAPPPGRYDVASLRSVLQVLAPDEAAAVVRHVAAALVPGGELYVVGRMLDDGRLSPPEAVAVNVMFLNVYEHGQAWTESEYRAWLSAAGLVDLVRQPLAGGYSVLRGVKPRD